MPIEQFTALWEALSDEHKRVAWDRFLHVIGEFEMDQMRWLEMEERHPTDAAHAHAQTFVWPM